MILFVNLLFSLFMLFGSIVMCVFYMTSKLLAFGYLNVDGGVVIFRGGKRY